ncbi:MAG: ATP-binding cassette domain-containing protein [Nitrospinaceae bacterium]|nr:ABC transporter ATP-binding protein [Nitrospinaceae bacterium]NIR56880.1 ABC transporter ATP-binding protein [Nitrospinaceae bacterium]NIS84583.1 ABC transporter ATP-binding protein [Nitrospinaceae bacterium]NIT81375.1 ABC transporter ATP-binding protein [Nitrospinaceae bacterium]NIU43662.1 ABC transporter ATP-binding protein [Nitrospinaceae bacterium]
MSEQPSSPASDAAIQVRGIRKHFGHMEALRGIDLDIRKGEFLSLFGPNGAGKTTLIRILSALTRPSSGTAFVAGYDVMAVDPEMRRQIGVISHSSFLYADLSPLENIRFYAKMYGVDRPEERAAAVIDEVGLKPRMHDRVRTFSRGMLQRLSIARAIVHDPSILFLDEPYTGLDQHASEILKEQLQVLHTDHRTILMTTHDFNRGLEMCDRVAIMARGKLALLEPIEALDPAGFERLYLDKVGQAGRA